MPTTDPKLTPMKEHQRVEDEERSSSNASSLESHTTSLLSSPSFQTTTRPNCSDEMVIESKAVSMANTECSSVLSSPVEGSPAKPAVAPTTFEGTNEKISSTSCIASASDVLKCRGKSLVNVSEPDSLPSCVLSFKMFGSPDPATEFPTVLTFKGVTVTLENNSVWKQFHPCGTEMILTKQGRRMFPYCRYRLTGLDPEQLYSLVLSIVPYDNKKYRWNTSKWEVTGPADHQAQGVIRAYSHHYSPCKGDEWMNGLTSFYKLKLTNNAQDLDGHIILHSMHRYIPRLHIIPVPDVPTCDQSVTMGAESMTFTFPQTEFMAVTTYQNFRITQLKINHNPFAKGFREDGYRVFKVNTEAQHLVNVEPQLLVINPSEFNQSNTWAINMSNMKDDTEPASASPVQETRLVLKPIMSASAHKDEPYVPCLRGKHSLGELVLVEKCPRLEPKEENRSVSPIPELQQDFKVASKAATLSPTCSTSTPRSTLRYRKRRKRINRHWGNAHGREWKAPSASSTVLHSPSLTVSMQPELDDVEGLLFVSFTTKEALEVHVGNKSADSSSSLSLVPHASAMQFKETVEVNPETDEKKMVRLEALLIQDLKSFKHRQIIHPVLQEVGLKLNSLDPTKSIDLQYLGVRLPIPPPTLPERANTTALSDAGLPFTSRTGKTSDMTKIKGWRNKFIRSKETSSNGAGQQKNLSAFCSNRLDEYLESEAQQISERAAAFSTNPETSVAYQLPMKSSSYVKTLDSVLKERKSISRFPAGANRPCPLSYKPLLYSALAAPPPPLASPADQAEAGSMQQSAASCTQPGAEYAASESGNTGSVSLKLPKNHQGVSQKSAFQQHHGMANKPSSLSKFQFKLLQMEIETQNQGLSRTQLTPNRLSVALSVMLTKEMMPNQVLKVGHYPEHKANGAECGQEFCRLGCVCSSINHPHRFPIHCRRPACMFGCACFKRRITKQMSAGESECESQPVYTVTELEAQPHLGHANKLWSRNIHDSDPEPLFIPTHPKTVVVSKVAKRSGSIQPIREEDKDPVYKYLESMMTCARVREFNSQPPPIGNIEPKRPDASTDTTTTENVPKQYYRTVTTVRKTENTTEDSTDSETEARKQIQIQSACDWSKDRKMVIDALCRRMSQRKLAQRFYVGPYRVRPVTKIFMRKPSGSIVTYRLQIAKQSKDSDSDVDEFEDGYEEKHAKRNVNGDMDAEEEDDKMEDSELWFGVMPFLSRVLPAGRLRALTQPSGCQAHGLIQVNGKSYNQARLLLGNIGSLHPANRLAAYVTGRINGSGKVLYKNSQKPDPSQKVNVESAMCIKAAGTVVPPVITASNTTDLKTPKQQQPPAQVLPADSVKKETTPLPQQSQNSTMLFSNQSRISPFQNSPTSSPVSLTVSPSLKTPSFLGQSGTYSFRICPPNNQSAQGQNLPGVTLPGGFTIIQLPKPMAGDAGNQSDSVNSINVTHKDLVQKCSSLNFYQSVTANKAGFVLDALNAVKEEAKEPSSSELVQCGSSLDLIHKETTQSDKNDRNKSSQSNTDLDSEDSSSNLSDYCGDEDDEDDDEDDEVVDVETVEDREQWLAIAKMKEAAAKVLQKSRDHLGSPTENNIQDQVDSDDSPGSTRRRNHVVLERLRRSEQRSLFDKLQAVLQTDPKCPRLRLLSLAQKEIRNLEAASKYLEQQKKSLMKVQALYVKRLSLLSGKSAKLIEQKLKEICDRQKKREKTMKWKPYFSQLLQSRAVLLQAISSQDRLKALPLLQPELVTASPQTVPPPAASLNNVTQTMLLQRKLHSAPAQTSAQPNKTIPPSPEAAQTTATAAPEIQPSESAASVQVDQLCSKGKEVSEAPGHFTPDSQSQPSTVPSKDSTFPSKDPTVPSKDPTVPSKDPTVPSKDPTVPSKDPTVPSKDSAPKSANPSKPVTLPLIRSKTGRLILPSSLKPSGQGFYTLMIVKARKKCGEGEVNSSPNMPPSDVSPENQKKNLSAPDQPSDSEGSSMLEELKTGSPKQSQESLETNSGVSLKQPLSTACLKFKPLPDIVNAEPSPRSAEVRRGRGRPRKSSFCSVSGMKEHEEVTGKDMRTGAGNPVPVKRKRGRPPKSSHESYDEEEYKIIQSYHRIKPKVSPAGTDLLHGSNTSRPLTRGALGKDFPSAKKRSWIDVEKELEPEHEFE